MNWHGETFYARNLEWQISDSKRLRQIVDRPGTAWVLVEQSRFDGVKKTPRQPLQRACAHRRSLQRKVVSGAD